ncbi:MAG TPA: hypothetical protein PKO44_01470 [Candidatus Omnitrophota bacterium]|nr:hypothetical protein [Candidatus Omnitrophota bacterium]
MRIPLLIFFLAITSFSACGNRRCDVEKCHGLDMSCAMVEFPRACTAIYQLGDFCRQYAGCKMVNGHCQLVKEEKFDICVACVQACATNAQKQDPFMCEQGCRSESELALEERFARAILGKAFDLKLGEAVFIEEGQLKIIFVRILEDSRCPENARCMWRGVVKIQLEIFKSDDFLGAIEIADEDFPHLSIASGSAVADYKIKFISFGNDVATLMVTKD